jgi:hypothetical protein
MYSAEHSQLLLFKIQNISLAIAGTQKNDIRKNWRAGAKIEEHRGCRNKNNEANEKMSSF